MTAGNVSRHRIALTALEQQREDAALGAAWRRCEAALPEGWGVGIEPQPDGRCLVGASPDTKWRNMAGGITVADALATLADRLEAGHG